MVNCGCVPLPLSPIVSGEPEPSLVIEMLPLALPVDAGANLAAKETLWPTFIVVGSDKPVMLKPVPEVAACEIVTLAVPELVRVIVCDALLPTRMPPKLTLAGAAETRPWVPVPARGIASVGFDALLVTVTFPAELPVPVGAN